MRTPFILLLTAAALLLLPEFGVTQAGLPEAQGLASQNLRGYTHMFIAYGIAWAVILGWAVSIARRLGKLERALKD